MKGWIEAWLRCGPSLPTKRQDQIGSTEVVPLDLYGGLKGTMSEAELHVLRARLRGGILSKARRGELMIPSPVGLVYNSNGELALDPDQQVQQSLRLLFETFRRTGSAAPVTGQTVMLR
jgi:DNA invertase Pin-like site-specific DNA recombinase